MKSIIDLTRAEWTVLRQAVFFKGLEDREIRNLLPCLEAEKVCFPKGAQILRVGDHVRRVGILLAGGATIERCDYWGNRHIVSAIFPGDTFGQSYAASPETALTVNIQASADSEVLFLDYSHILLMCASSCPFHTRLIANLMSMLATQNLALNEKLTYVTQRTLRDKLLTYLSAESMRQQSAYFDIPFDRQQLADYLNAERSALSNELSKLRREGIIDFQKQHFHLLVKPDQFPEKAAV